jgi:hypothetical protein
MDPPRLSQMPPNLHSPSDSYDAKYPTPVPHDAYINAPALDSPGQSNNKAKKRKRASVNEESPLEDPYQDMDSLLSQKRKPRNKTACVPCRKRKVGCDKMAPCQTCVERRHSELCVYETTAESGTPFASVMSPTTPDNVSVPRVYLDMLMAKVDRLEGIMSDLRQEMKVVTGGMTNGEMKSPAIDPGLDDGEGSDDVQRRDGVHTNNPVTGQIVHVGGNSVPALLMSLAKHHSSQSPDQHDWSELINGNIIPLLGLDNESATYPFIDLWSIPEEPIIRIKKIALFLPVNEEIGRLFLPYKQIAQAIFPAIANMEKFESDLLQFRYRRSQESIEVDVTEQTIHGKKVAWVGLLFAVLASGCHFSEHLDRSKRELTSKIYICCSFECLRMTNFLSNPTLESIQALAVFLNVLLNMYNAGVSWAMLGLAIRLGQSLGLHRSCPPSTRRDTVIERSRTWWALIWQDSIISVTYDRAGAAVHSACESIKSLPPDVASLPVGTWTFDRCMYELCRISLGIISERHEYKDIHHTLYRMAHFEKKIIDIKNAASQTVQDLAQCNNLSETIQHWLVHIHASYVLCELYRPAVSPGAPATELVARMRSSCIENLRQVVQGWLGLFSVSYLTNRSWPAMQRALSSALLLGILRETEHDPSVRYLLNEFLGALEQVIAGMETQAIWAPLERSIFWLRKLVNGAGSEGSSPRLPDFSGEDSPHAMMEKLMWQGT